jgi:hypothetical protein
MKPATHFLERLAKGESLTADDRPAIEGAHATAKATPRTAITFTEAGSIVALPGKLKAPAVKSLFASAGLDTPNHADTLATWLGSLTHRLPGGNTPPAPTETAEQRQARWTREQAAFVRGPKNHNRDGIFRFVLNQLETAAAKGTTTITETDLAKTVGCDPLPDGIRCRIASIAPGGQPRVFRMAEAIATVRQYAEAK